MAQQLLTESPEKTKQQIARREVTAEAARSAHDGSPSPILQLHRTLGNQRVAQLIQAKRLTQQGKILGFQPKLTVGAADDQYEQEADRIARHVVSMPESVALAALQPAPPTKEHASHPHSLQSKPLPLAATITPFVQRTPHNANDREEDKKQDKADEVVQARRLSDPVFAPLQRQETSEKNEEEPIHAKHVAGSSTEALQRQADAQEEDRDSIQAKSAASLAGSFDAGEDVESRLSQSKGGGSPLPDPVRAYMEPRFGVDFSHVRVHTGNHAVQMNQAVAAQAFTHGADIYYGAGSSPTNLDLTAHELTHVVQQTGGAPLQTKKQAQPVTLGPEPPVQRTCAACTADATPCTTCADDRTAIVQRRVSMTAGPLSSTLASGSPVTMRRLRGGLPPQDQMISLQRQRTVGAEDDHHEQETDRIARYVRSTPAAVTANSRQPTISSEEDKSQTLQSKPLADAITPLVQRQTAKDEEHEDTPVSRLQTMSLQRLSLTDVIPDWALDLLNKVRGDASTQETQVKSDASTQAGELESQGTTRSTELQSQSTTQGTALQGEASTQGGQLNQGAAAQGTALQSQASAQGAQLNGESSARAAALQQEATATTTHLQGNVGALDNEARSTEATTEGALATDADGIQGEADTSAGLVQGQWQGLETRTTGRLTSLTTRTQTLMDQKTALVSEYQSAGTHDPERFQQRWDTLQKQTGAVEQEQSSLDGVEGSGEALSERASTIWANLSTRGQALLTRVTSVASDAWTALQSHWSTLQGTAAMALAGLQSRASAAVNGLKSLATSAWTGLRGAATQAWAGLKGMATGAWTGLQSRATAAWTSLQSQATKAWTALQGIANSAVSGLADKISGIVSRINGTIGHIISFVASAVESLLSKLRSATSTALTFLRTRASAAWNAVKSLGTRAWDGLKNLGTRAWEGLKRLGTRAWEGLKNLGTRAWEGLKSLGTRAWEGLKNLGQRAWNGLKSGWEWLKKKAQAAWGWLRNAWEKVKRKAGQLWDWLKRKAREALTWLKQKWAWLIAMVRRAWAWLKAKWKWLKSLVKIKIKIPDQTLCKVHPFKPWKFVNLHSGRIPIVKTVVDSKIGPVELALFVQADAEATVGGTVGPCSLKNIAFTLQPLISRYTGQADFHIGATVNETLKLTGTIGGTANYGGLIGLVGGGLQGTGAANALGSFTAKPRFVYDSGKIMASIPIRLEFCLMPTIDLDAFLVAQLLEGKAPSAAPSPTPIFPGPMPSLPGSATPGSGMSPSVPTIAGATPPAKAPPEKVLKEWKARWHLARWSKRECWDVQARFTLVSGPGGLPEADLQFTAKPESLADVVRSVFELPPQPLANGSGGKDPVIPVPVPGPGVLTDPEPTRCDPLNKGATPTLTEGDTEHGRTHIEQRHAYKTGTANSWFLENGTSMSVLTGLLGDALPMAKGNWKSSPDRVNPALYHCVAGVNFGSRQVGWEVKNRKTDPPNVRPMHGLFMVVRSTDLEVVSMFPIKVK